MSEGKAENDNVGSFTGVVLSDPSRTGTHIGELTRNKSAFRTTRDTRFPNLEICHQADKQGS
jgi:hypothetical protein